uniref:Bm8102 n=1 Tax=Brugia malayi TaxID=6279 RepID=A0A1I9G690_BRUMA|nr:Bm8102 [Brugia malayi]
MGSYNIRYGILQLGTTTNKETINEEIGTRPQPPSRKRKATEEQSQLLKKYCDNEITITEMTQYDNIFVMRNLSRIQQLKSYITKDRSSTTDLYLIIGHPGIGKTTFAITLSKNYYIKTANTEKWWDGYEQQELVILDDFYGWLQPTEIFNLADSKSHLVQIKGGLVKFTSKAIVITSNKIPEQWWKRRTVMKYDMCAFDRRVNMTWKKIAQQKSQHDVEKISSTEESP